MREWNYWTRNKLMILKAYLPVLVTASKKSRRPPVYLDLMAGEPDNLAKETREWFDGSARLAMGCEPQFGQVILFEKSAAKAQALAADLESKFPEDERAHVVVGDCNVTIHRELARLRREGWAWAPTFAFLDQQVAEIGWTTVEALAKFRQGRYKVEMWMLVSPTMFNRSLGPRSQPRRERIAAVTRMYGTDGWERIYRAQEAQVITASEARQEWINLMRWRLQHTLGYRNTASLPMHMDSGLEIYEMVFATDHPAGEKVMRYLYKQAAEREPGLMAQSAAARKNRKAADTQPTLFPFQADEFATDHLGEWEPTPVHDPATLPWWYAV
jgi:three-Cys-motif partner protein